MQCNVVYFNPVFLLIWLNTWQDLHHSGHSFAWTQGGPKIDQCCLKWNLPALISPCDLILYHIYALYVVCCGCFLGLDQWEYYHCNRLLRSPPGIAIIVPVNQTVHCKSLPYMVGSSCVFYYGRGDSFSFVVGKQVNGKVDVCVTFGCDVWNDLSEMTSLSLSLISRLRN